MINIYKTRVMKKHLDDDFQNPPDQAMKLFEYLATGVPIVASDIPSNTEILTENKNCILFNSDDSDNLSQEVKKLWQDYSLREKISKNSIELSRQFTWKNRCKVIIDEIREIK